MDAGFESPRDSTGPRQDHGYSTGPRQDHGWSVRVRARVRVMGDAEPWPTLVLRSFTPVVKNVMKSTCDAGMIGGRGRVS